MTIKIEKGIPLPDDDEPGADPLVPELRQMEVGDSILIPTKPDTGEAMLKSIDLHLWALKNKLRFETRAQEGGLRIWRTK